MFNNLKSKKGLAPVVVIILIVIGIALVAGGVYWWQIIRVAPSMSSKEGLNIVVSPDNLYFFETPSDWKPTGESENTLELSDGIGTITARVLVSEKFKEKVPSGDFQEYLKVQKEQLKEIPEIKVLKEEFRPWGSLQAYAFEYYESDIHMKGIQVMVLDKDGNLLNLLLKSDISDWEQYGPLYERVITSTTIVNR